MELEGDSFDEVGEVIGAAHYARFGVGSSATDGDRPAMGVVWIARRGALLGRQELGGVTIDDRAVYGQTLRAVEWLEHLSKRARRTRTRTRSAMRSGGGPVRLPSTTSLAF